MRVYFAAPVETYIKPRHEHLLANVKDYFSDAEIILARDTFSSNQHWRDTWPILCKTLDAMVFIADEYGFIGAGIYQEIEDVRARHKRVYYADENGIYKKSDITIRPTGYHIRSTLYWRRHARIAISRRALPLAGKL